MKRDLDILQHTVESKSEETLDIFKQEIHVLRLNVKNHQVLFMLSLLLLSLKHKRDNIARHLETYILFQFNYLLNFSFSRMKPFHQRFQTF